MSRWEPDARGRMMRAALELFDERGFERTTAGDIAERAGVTERTFFRHFADKREAFFDEERTTERRLREAIAAAPAGAAPIDAALAGGCAAAGFLEDRREQAARRARIIARTPRLRERELLKLADLTRAAAEALRERGATEETAVLAAHCAASAFRVAFARWIGDGAPDFPTCADEAAVALRALF
ncbi:helix-turn-helix domain-containing protein [Saccharopolyspora sp. MS10]|uniref:TetR/AcrR family transcriptional regulator n=1 Tax=Saccharopolyspora sp. MS10 TaxID=3385973 RepID=UPI00399FC6A2